MTGGDLSLEERKNDRDVEIASTLRSRATAEDGAPPVGRLAMTAFCFVNTRLNGSLHQLSQASEALSPA